MKVSYIKNLSVNCYKSCYKNFNRFKNWIYIENPKFKPLDTPLSEIHKTISTEELIEKTLRNL